jgi:hypothetical protein
MVLSPSHVNCLDNVHINNLVRAAAESTSAAKTMLGLPLSTYATDTFGHSSFRYVCNTKSRLAGGTYVCMTSRSCNLSSTVGVTHVEPITRRDKAQAKKRNAASSAGLMHAVGQPCSKHEPARGKMSAQAAITSSTMLFLGCHHLNFCSLHPLVQNAPVGHKIPLDPAC